MRARIGVIAFALLLVAVPSLPSAAALTPEQVTTAPTTTTTTAPTTTTQAPTTTTATTAAPTTTSLATTTTVAPTTTSSSTSTTSTTVPTTTTTAGSGGSGTSAGTIGLIVAALVAVLLIILLLVLLLRRRRSQEWRLQARGAAAEADNLLGVLTTGLAGLDDPARAARTWSDLDSRGTPLHARLQTLAVSAPDPAARAAVTGLDRDLQALRAAVDADRALRLGPPPPTAEQLGYAAAVIRQRAADFEQSLGDLDRLVSTPE